MAYVTIDPASIEVGDALRKELFDTIKTDLDDLDTRVTALSTGAKKVELFKYVLLNGSAFSTATGLDYYQAIESFTVTNAEIRIFEKGALTGSIEIDVKKSTTNMDDPSFSSIFTTKPKIIYASAVDYETSTNQVFNGGQISISAGDILRLDITIAPTNGVLPKLQLIIYGEN
jgi:hypothetical protein